MDNTMLISAMTMLLIVTTSLSEGAGMNGIRRGDEMIYITHLQCYKKPVLIIGNEVEVKVWEEE